MKRLMVGRGFLCLFLLAMTASFMVMAGANTGEGEEGPAEPFTWWPTDATPGSVKDQERGGY